LSSPNYEAMESNIYIEGHELYTNLPLHSTYTQMPPIYKAYQ
jgi:hypothetical protein